MRGALSNIIVQTASSWSISINSNRHTHRYSWAVVWPVRASPWVLHLVTLESLLMKTCSCVLRCCLMVIINSQIQDVSTKAKAQYYCQYCVLGLSGRLGRPHA